MNRDLVILVDERGQALLGPDGATLTAPKLVAHRQGLLHLAVSVFIFNERGELLIQKRAGGKYHSSGKWSNTCCTHPLPGETPLDAARRRLPEEMGLTAQIEEIFTFLYKTELDSGLTEHEFDHVFFGITGAVPQPDPSEVTDWRWIGLQELQTELAGQPEAFTYWLGVCLPEVAKQMKRRSSPR